MRVSRLGRRGRWERRRLDVVVEMYETPYEVWKEMASIYSDPMAFVIPISEITRSGYSVVRRHFVEQL